MYEGLRRDVSLGTLHLIRKSVDDVLDQIWEMAYQADEVSRQWSNIIAFFRCLELKSEIAKPENSVEYIPSKQGMKIEARDIHYKYNPDNETEILKGASFLIEPGKMIAVVGYVLQVE